MKKIFLTGGFGFVGQNIIPILLKNNYEVLALARSAGSAQKVKALGAQPILDDLTNLSINTAHALEDCVAVVHSAALMDFTYDPKPFYALNVQATERLLELSKKAGIQRFIYISAAPVVPGSPIVNLSEREASKGLPTALYPKTKAIAEQKVLAANSATFGTVALRPPAIWGPDNPHFEELFARVKDGKWRWIGGGEQILSTIHVENLANAILAGLDSTVGGKAYFVTDGERRSMKSFFTAMLQAQGLTPGDKVLPMWIASTAAYGMQFIWKLFRLKSRPPVAPLMLRLLAKEFSISDQCARKELGYTNALTIEEGLEQLRQH